MCERVGREARVIKDHRLGLVPKEPDLQFVPELGGILARRPVTEPVEPSPGLVAMPETMVSHGQEHPVLG